MNDRRLLFFGIPLVAALALFSRSTPDSTMAWLLGAAISLSETCLFWLSNRALWLALHRRFPQVEQTGRRIWWLALGSVGFGALTTLLLGEGLSLLLRHNHFQVSEFGQEFVLNMVPTLVVQMLYETLHFFQQWKANLLRADRLAHASTQAELDALLSQLDPHFLFNNLNTLAALIEPGNAPAQQFVEQLADVYRYVLLAQGQATVPLAEELAFVETYLALHKARFRNNLVVEQHLPPAVLARRVAPLSVQLLVENALKHNVASRQHPLHLRLSTAPENPETLLVENNLQPRTAGLAPGTGTGLANVHRRYALLNAPRPVEVVTTNGTFLVKLPLLRPKPLL